MTVMTGRRAERRWRREERKRRGADFADIHSKNISIQPQQSSAAAWITAHQPVCCCCRLRWRPSSSLVCRSTLGVSGIHRQHRLRYSNVYTHTHTHAPVSSAAMTRSVNRLRAKVHALTRGGLLPCNQTVLFESITSH